MKTYVPKQGDIKQDWFVLNAEGQTLGRLASKIATILCGKHKPVYIPYIDTGDFVIVTNAGKVKITGKKEMQKKYFYYSGHPGGMKEISYKDMMRKYPERVIREAVRGMVPHNKLGRAMMKKLKVYSGPAHLHEAQTPKALEM